MELYGNTQESDLLVPQRTLPKTRLEDFDTVLYEPKLNSRIKDDVILGALGLLGFGLIIGVFAFM